MTTGLSERAKFITIEGVEGVGKSTNIAVIEKYLQQQGVDYLLTREPGGTLLAESIRDRRLSEHGETVDPTTERRRMCAGPVGHRRIR